MESAQELRIEPRWPVIVAILGLLFLLATLPERVRAVPSWVAYVAGIVVIVPMVAVVLSDNKTRWLPIERTVILILFVTTGTGTLANLANLIRGIVGRSAEISGLQLLASSIAVWVTNVVIFSLLYWVIDRGGPEARANNIATKPDWLFPQTDAPEEAPLDWRPTYIDYLFLGFCTATAFSPTDAMPLTSRAKMLMLFESTISLVTIVVVASRAINILGS